ncbi:MAG: HAD-IA family hydrolase [Verrucomicrobiales bacterium]|nr:HAD-IA family hydrolase [Verrucomicrobiales bacterium]
MVFENRDPEKPLLMFDFDGTLANTLETGIEIFNEIAPDYELHPITIHEARELRRLHTRALLDRLGISRLMAIKVGAHIKRLLHQRMDEVELILGTEEAIMELFEAGYPLGILSSNSTDNIRSFLDRFGLLHCFGFIEAGVSLFGKPQRIRNVLRKEKFDSENAIYVGDETRDMEASRKVGVCGIAVCWGANGRDAMMTEGPEFCIDDPAELIHCAREFSDRQDSEP